MLIHAELEIGLVGGGELKFDRSFLQFDVKKMIYAKSYKVVKKHS